MKRPTTTGGSPIPVLTRAITSRRPGKRTSARSVPSGMPTMSESKVAVAESLSESQVIPSTSGSPLHISPAARTSPSQISPMPPSPRPAFRAR